MEIKVFTQEGCPNCPAARSVVETVADGKKVKVRVFDVDDVDGMAQSQFYSVMGTPTTIVVDDDESEIVSWRSQVPDKSELSNIISAY